MLTYNSKDLMHWNLFISLEDDLEKASKYIEFCLANEGAYSIELAKILMSASSEVDVVMKMIGNHYGKNLGGINEYRELAQEYFPEISKEMCRLPRFQMQFIPWENWNGDTNPFWWQGYNKVKHVRNIHYDKANLKNCINSVGALMIALVYYHKLTSGLSFKEVMELLTPSSRMYKMSEEYYYQLLRLS